MTQSRNWKDKVRSVLPWKTYWFLKRILEELRAFASKGDMTSLAKVYQTDIWGYHFYTPIYEKWFRLLRY